MSSKHSTRETDAAAAYLACRDSIEKIQRVIAELDDTQAGEGLRRGC